MALDDNDAILDFIAANDTARLFNIKAKTTGKIGEDGKKYVEMMYH